MKYLKGCNKVFLSALKYSMLSKNLQRLKYIVRCVDFSIVRRTLLNTVNITI